VNFARLAAYRRAFHPRGTTARAAPVIFQTGPALDAWATSAA